MTGTLSFKFDNEPFFHNPTHTKVAPEEAGSNVDRKLPNPYLFTSSGNWNVSFRASIIRLALFKLAGTGLVAFIMALSSSTGRHTSFSCAMSAAVNFVACCHYYFIWQIRRQVYTYVDDDPEAQPLTKQDPYNEQDIFNQEGKIDGFRYSDWLCTLVLMTLDIGHFRQYLSLVTAGAVPDLFISKEWLATLQSIMIFAASVWRFYSNEARGQSKGTTILGVVSFLVSMGIFFFIVWVMLHDIPNTVIFKDESIRSDIYGLWVLTIVWVGYPMVSIASSIAHRSIPADKYNETWSLLKDISFAFLDVASKGGLALFFALKATWVDNAKELALIASANNSVVGS